MDNGKPVYDFPLFNNYTMAVLTYKALHGGSPRYLSSLVHVANRSGRPALHYAG